MSEVPQDPTERFSGRASAYDRARPGYPPAMFDHLFAVGALFPGCAVADLGSGTGIFSSLLLERGLPVYAVEPNRDMRSVAETRLSGRKGFNSVAGSAERTTLPDGSVDAATAAQAFHWFDIDRTRAEMRRILRPRGQVIMVWNNRVKDHDEFNSDYSKVVDRYAREKGEIDQLRKEPQDLFFPSGYHHAEFEHAKEHDLESLECLITSASYMPKEGEGGFQEMIAELRSVFALHNVDGKVMIRYRTDCFHGSLD